MVPLKSEVWSDDSFRAGDRHRPAKREPSQTSTIAPSRRRRTSKVRGRDNQWFVAMVVVLALFVIGAAVSTLRSNVDEAWARLGATPCRVAVTVKPGDTLWTFARRYGAPGSYILDSVDAIARDNDLDPSGTLVPGQKLMIRVENPAVLAKLQRSPKVASVE